MPNGSLSGLNLGSDFLGSGGSGGGVGTGYQFNDGKN